MTNIANLLQSKPDKYSDLNGVELVNKKVKRWVCMAGIFPEGGDECNASSDYHGKVKKSNKKISQ